jgi:hypothetical protein
LKQISKRQSKINKARAILKKEIKKRLVGAYLCLRCAKCRNVMSDSEFNAYTLDEIEGRHTSEYSIPDALDPEGMQALCLRCHQIKTDFKGGHIDFRNPYEKNLMWELALEIQSHLPNLEGTKLKQNLDEVCRIIQKLYGAK